MEEEVREETVEFTNLEQQLEAEIIKEELLKQKRKKSRLIQLWLVACLFFLQLAVEIVLIATNGANDANILNVIFIMLAPQLLTIFWFLKKL